MALASSIHGKTTVDQTPAQAPGAPCPELPMEIFALIFQNLSAGDRNYQAARVCKLWYEAAQNKFFWVQFCNTYNLGEPSTEAACYKTYAKTMGSLFLKPPKIQIKPRLVDCHGDGDLESVLLEFQNMPAISSDMCHKMLKDVNEIVTRLTPPSEGLWKIIEREEQAQHPDYKKASSLKAWIPSNIKITDESETQIKTVTSRGACIITLLSIMNFTHVNVANISTNDLKIYPLLRGKEHKEKLLEIKSSDVQSIAMGCIWRGTRLYYLIGNESSSAAASIYDFNDSK